MYTGLTNGAREGARLAIVNQDIGRVEQRVQETSFGSTISNVGNVADPVVAYYQEDPNLNNPTANPRCTTIATGCVAGGDRPRQLRAITPTTGSHHRADRADREVRTACGIRLPEHQVPELRDPRPMSETAMSRIRSTERTTTVKLPSGRRPAEGRSLSSPLAPWWRSSSWWDSSSTVARCTPSSVSRKTAPTQYRQRRRS